MGSIVDGTIAVMGMIAGLMLVYMSLRASEPMSGAPVANQKVQHSPVKSHRKAA